MKKIKYHLDFVNDDKPFELPNWTPKKHEAALNKLDAATKGMTERQKNEEFKYYVVHETLITIDENCELEKVKNMHPLDLVELFHAVYNAGRKGIYFREAKKAPSKRKQESTGTKN